MQEYYTHKQKRIKIWIDETSEIPSYKGDMVEHQQKRDAGNLGQKDIVMEFSMPMNFSNYGCLGVKYIPSQTGSLKIGINSKAEWGPILEGRLSFNKGCVSLGINSEYVDVMMKYIMLSGEINKIPSGELIFYTGAYSEVGSSLMTYLISIEILLRLLLSDNCNFSEKEIEDLMSLSITTSSEQFKGLKERGYEEITCSKI
jgi:hypothetical protein